MKVNSNKTTPIYIEGLVLKNVRSFKGEIELSFTKRDGSLSQWTLILGDNGIGKSTILQCVAWMRPDVQDTSGVGMDISIEQTDPIINNEDNETLQGLVSKSINTLTETTHITGNFLANVKLNGVATKSKKIWCKTKTEIKLDKNLKLADVINEFKTSSDRLFRKTSIFIFGYSASRILGKTNISDYNLSDSISSFITDSTVLYDAEQILHTMNYAALGATDKKERKKYLSYIKVVKEALVSLLPDFDKVDDIEIASPKINSNILQEGLLTVSTKHGKKIPFSDFSLGYKTVMSWVIDLSWRLFNSYPNSEEPLKEPAIVLIDELDLHLHPIWQRQIIKHLSAHFPNIQFIATAHSPLMVQAALEENYAVLNFDTQNNCVKVIKDLKSIDGWRVDQILTSEFFGLKTARGLEYEELLKEREKIISKSRLSAKDKKRLADIAEKMADYPIGETSAEIENRQIIKSAAKFLKDNNIKIEI